MAIDNANSLDVTSLLREMPATREGRWNVLKTFFKGWFGEIGAGDGYSEQSIRDAEERLKLRLPAALREWYALAGRRAEIWSCQDHFLTPEDLRAEGDKLIFYMECQAAAEWGLEMHALQDDDPPVYVTDPLDSGTWKKECPSVSIFALAQMLLSAKFSGSTKYSANGHAPDEALAAIAQRYARLAIPDLSWPAEPTRFFGNKDLLIETDGDTWIWVSGLQAATFREAVDLIAGTGMTWEQVTEQ